MPNPVSCLHFYKTLHILKANINQSIISIFEMGSVCCKKIKKERIFRQKCEIQKAIPFLWERDGQSALITKEGKQYLLDLPKGTNLVFVMNYTNSQQFRSILLQKYIPLKQEQIENHEDIKVYLTTIGHCDNYTAVLLDCFSQKMDKHTLCILFSISSIFLFTNPKFQPSIDDLRPIIPISVEALNEMRKFGRKMQLPTFLWLHKTKHYSNILRPERQDSQNDRYQAKKRNLDRQFFKQLYPGTLILNYGQTQVFHETTTMQQLRLKILSNLEPRVINGLQFSPIVVLEFIHIFEEYSYFSYISNYWQKFTTKIQRFFEKQVKSLIHEYKPKQYDDVKDNRNLHRKLMEIVDQHKTYACLNHRLFKNFANLELKKMGLDSIEEMIQRRKRTSNKGQIDFSLVEEEIDQRIKDSKQSIYQVLALDRKRLESEGDNIGGATRVSYLEKVRDFFDQKMREEILRLEKENAIKTEQNAALQAENERIKMKLQCESEKSSKSNRGSSEQDFMNSSKQELL